jgi:hypothetical protein
MFTTDDLKRAKLIVKKVAVLEKAAAQYPHPTAMPGIKPPSSFGKLEGDPNTFNQPWPRYNEPAPAWMEHEQQPTFMQSIGQMGKGLYRMGMGGAAAATLGQNGSPGMAENVLGNAAHGVRDVWAGSGPWGQVPGWVRKPLAPIAGPWYGALNTPGEFKQPFGRYMYNSSSDRAMAAAPYTWARRNWRDVVQGWNQFMGNRDQ